MIQSNVSPYANLSGNELVERLKEDLPSNKWDAEKSIFGPEDIRPSPLESKTRIGRIQFMILIWMNYFKLMRE